MNILYDFAKYPASWDFLQWLINADIRRRAHNDRRLGIAFAPGPLGGFRDDTGERPLEARRKIFDNVIRPSLELVGAVESESADPDIKFSYVARPAVEWDRKGGVVPFYKVPQSALDEARAYLGDRRPVLITLREASYHPRRNSNLAAWTAFARSCGEDVIFIRDTAKADEPLDGFETCPRASKELLFRAGLMAHAKCNLMMANGPWNLALYSSVPWLNFGSWRPDLPDYKPGAETWWRKHIIPVNSQFPWSSPANQRMIWKNDDLEHITEAWQQVASSLGRRRRRTVNKEWEQQFAAIRERTARYGDALLRIDTIKMYEGIDDGPADMLVACDLLEHLAEPMQAVAEMNQLATKTLMFCVRYDAIRTEDWWQRKFNRAVNVTSWYAENGMLTCIAQAGMKLQGVTVTGAMTTDDRWSHLEYSRARFSKRIAGAPAHGRTAVLACYGPSLQEYLPKLREVVTQTKGTLISVSGAHDFLLRNDVVPDFHIECDPRPHKAANINLPDGRVKYLIGSSCHPSYFDKLAGCDIALWHVSESRSNMRLVDELGESVDTIVSGGGSVGLRSLPLLHHLGYRRFEIFGMDCSFKDERPVEEIAKQIKDDAHDDSPLIEMWAGGHAGKRQMPDYAVCGEQIFTTSASLMAYATQFFDLVKRLPDAKFQVWGDGLLPAMCRHYWKNPQLEQAA